MWTQAEGIALCKQIESIAPDYNCHVALTGGLLYKEGARKDCDILLYRIREREINRAGLFKALSTIGIETTYESAWVVKAMMGRHVIDFFFPDEPDNGEYGHGDDEEDAF